MHQAGDSTNGLTTSVPSLGGGRNAVFTCAKKFLQRCVQLVQPVQK